MTLKCRTQNQRRKKTLQYSESFNKAVCNDPTIEKEIFTVITRIG